MSNTEKILHERIIRLCTAIEKQRPRRAVVKRWIRNYKLWSKSALENMKLPPCPECRGVYRR